MKIAFFEVEKDKQAFFENVLPGVEVSFFEERLDEKTVSLAKDADILCVFVTSLVNKNTIDVMPNLKFIATRTTGFNHIDCEYAKSKNIFVSNVPAYGSHTVAEFTFALLLTLSRKMREAGQAIKENGDFSIPKTVQGFDLDSKTIGVVGTGKIGKNVIQIARGFNMNVLAYDLHPDLDFATKNNFSYKTLPEVLSQSDIVTLHAPYTKENHHLINKENISQFKKGAYLINTARGELVDTGALTFALEEGIIAGAGLDVLEEEKSFIKGGVIPLLEMPNVIMTPHTAFNTKEAEFRIAETTIENIKSFISGTPINLVQ
ncbi:MAG: NAD(P)-dependent oxidoreductase [Candidatus Paceibacterota bacterium]